MKRNLPIPLDYVNRHLTGQPLFMYLWFIWLISCFLIGFAADASSNDRFSARAQVYYWIWLCALVLLIIRLIALLFNNEDRKWLLSVQRDTESAPPRTDFRILVRVVPILGLIIVLEYLLF